MYKQKKNIYHEYLLKKINKIISYIKINKKKKLQKQQQKLYTISLYAKPL